MDALEYIVTGIKYLFSTFFNPTRVLGTTNVHYKIIQFLIKSVHLLQQQQSRQFRIV